MSGRTGSGSLAGGRTLDDTGDMKSQFRCGSFVGLAVLVASASSCGSSSGGGGGVGGPLGCAQVEPCGGDVVGTWTLAASCINTGALSAMLASVCPGASASAAAPTISGTLTFNSDLTYVANGVTGTVAITEVVPLSCTGDASCAAFAQTLTAGATSPVSVNCSGSSTCTCAISGSMTTMTESGTYATTGTMLSTIPTTGAQSDDPYCVKGSTLHVLSIDTTMNMGPMGQATIESDTVAQRQ